MKISYESTLDEAVASHMRLWELSHAAKGWKREGLFLIPVLSVILSWLLQETTLTRIVSSVICCAVLIPVYLHSYKKTIRKRTRKMLAEQLGTTEPVPCEFEFTQDGLVFRRQGMEHLFRWSAVQSVNIVERGIEVIMVNHGGLAVIPGRIFKGNEMQEWFDFASARVSRKV